MTRDRSTRSWEEGVPETYTTSERELVRTGSFCVPEEKVKEFQRRDVSGILFPERTVTTHVRVGTTE